MDRVHRHAFFMQRVGMSLPKTMKLGGFDADLFRNRLQPAQEVTVGSSFSIWKYQVLRLGFPLPHSVLDFLTVPRLSREPAGRLGPQSCGSTRLFPAP